MPASLISIYIEQSSATTHKPPILAFAALAGPLGGRLARIIRRVIGDEAAMPSAFMTLEFDIRARRRACWASRIQQHSPEAKAGREMIAEASMPRLTGGGAAMTRATRARA